MGNRIFNNHTPYQMVNQLTKYIGRATYKTAWF